MNFKKESWIQKGITEREREREREELLQGGSDIINTNTDKWNIVDVFVHSSRD